MTDGAPPAGERMPIPMGVIAESGNTHPELTEEALRHIVPDDEEALGALKGPDYVGHAYGPASPEIKEEMAELDRQIAHALQIIERKAGAGRFAIAIAADHGMPGEPRPGGRHYVDEIAKRIDARFSPGGGTVVQYFTDAANNEIHLDTAKLRSLKVSLRDVAAYLEAEVPFAAVYTEDEVRAAQRRER